MIILNRRKILSKENKLFFQKNGYLVVNDFFSKKNIDKVLKKVPEIFNGKYDTGISPDRVKWNKNEKKKIPRQICNSWKASKVLREIITNKKLAQIAAYLSGWDGVKLGQDSLMWVPSKNGGVSMHQDNPYQDWHSSKKTVTCVVALTNLNNKNSGLQFLQGSHKKGKDKPIKHFFNGKNFDYTVKSEGFEKFKMVSLNGKAGTISFHHGNIWHGSNVNNSNSNRISISIHYIPISSKYDKKINHPIYSQYKKFNTLEMDESFFPILWSKNNRRSKYLIK